MTKNDITSLVGVLCAGGAGGFGFWLLGIWANTPMFPGFSRAGQIAALMFIGALAATIGVYLLTASDLTSMRTYIFALVCGLVWQPITDAGKRLVVNASVSNKIAQANRSVDQLRSATRGGSSEIEGRINSTVPSITQVLQSSPTVQDSTKQDEIAKASASAINAIVDVSHQAPLTSITALTGIASEAARVGQTDVAVHAVQGVRTIGFLAAETGNLSIASDATKSLQSIALESPGQTTKAAAENSATSIQLKVNETPERK